VLVARQKRLRKPPSALALADLDAALVNAFLDVEQNRGVITRTRNLRLTAIRSFFRYAAYQEPASYGQIQQVLSIPSKRHDRRCDVVLREGAHVRCLGKGRKERSAPLTSQMVGVLKIWLKYAALSTSCSPTSMAAE
jgi:integrase/recombinase XerD